MYAIVDIETTGGYAANNDITEVAIVLHDGQTITEKFETLVRPVREIPYFIQVLTGITPQMVAEAPTLEELAPRIISLLEGRTFVAHNVNFDYSFLKHHLEAAGYDLHIPKLCTVRLSRHIFPGLSSYSLGNLCRHFGIVNNQRHRAGGDALATARLFQLLLEADGGKHIGQQISKQYRQHALPPHLPAGDIENLPYTPGVYYFHDEKGKVVYVGKAKNLKYRVKSHFTNNGTGRQRQNFLRNVYRISYQSCSTELMAFIMENIEIRRLWPRFNYSQKRFQPAYGLFTYEDQRGYQHLVMEKKSLRLKPLYTFGLQVEGHRLLRQLVNRFSLCPKLCALQLSSEPCQGADGQPCTGVCLQQEAPAIYNERVRQAIEFLNEYLPTFALLESGNEPGSQVCILVEKGRFYGMGHIPEGLQPEHADALKPHLTAYPESDYIRGLIYSFAEKSPEKKIMLPHA